MRHLRHAWPALVVVAVDPAAASAGMPSVRLTDAATLRFETLSFFLLLFAVSSLVVWRVWNALRTDFPRLPWLSYPKAVGVVGLWGLLFLLVLTMISGARELMTPGAWKKDGLTYTLADDKRSDAPPEPERRAKLLLLSAALAGYAAAHDGKYPDDTEASISFAVWKSAHASGLRFRYVPGRTSADVGKVLAYEPQVFGDAQWVLFVGGDVRALEWAKLAPLLSPEGR